MYLELCHTLGGDHLVICPGASPGVESGSIPQQHPPPHHHREVFVMQPSWGAGEKLPPGSGLLVS